MWNVKILKDCGAPLSYHNNNNALLQRGHMGREPPKTDFPFLNEDRCYGFIEVS
jgi:hypothetical protein